jgi:cytochrome b561
MNEIASGQQQTKKPKQNSAFLRLMSVHWWMARLYVVLFLGGWFMTHLPKGSNYRTILYDFHKSIGILTIAILTWRILVLLQVWWRKYTKRLPKLSPSWIKTFILHTLLYVFMWATPVTGVFLSNSFQINNVKLFGIGLPDLFPQNSAVVELARNLHFWVAYIFLAFTILHLIAQWKVIRAHCRQIGQLLQRTRSQWFF